MIFRCRSQRSRTGLEIWRGLWQVRSAVVCLCFASVFVSGLANLFAVAPAAAPAAVAVTTATAIITVRLRVRPATAITATDTRAVMQTTTTTTISMPYQSRAASVCGASLKVTAAAVMTWASSPRGLLQPRWSVIGARFAAFTQSHSTSDHNDSSDRPSFCQWHSRKRCGGVVG